MVVEYSIIIPAYNESRWLPDTLKIIHQAMDTIPFQGEVIVTDNNSTDNTAELAQQHGAKVVFEPVNQISRARNAGARVAVGNYFVFIDADTHISPEVLKTALDNLQSKHCCGGGAVVAFDHDITPAQTKALAVWTWISTRLKLGAAVSCIVRKKILKPWVVLAKPSMPVKKSGFQETLNDSSPTREKPFVLLPSPLLFHQAENLNGLASGNNCCC